MLLGNHNDNDKDIDSSSADAKANADADANANACANDRETCGLCDGYQTPEKSSTGDLAMGIGSPAHRAGHESLRFTCILLHKIPGRLQQKTQTSGNTGKVFFQVPFSRFSIL